MDQLQRKPLALCTPERLTPRRVSVIRAFIPASWCPGRSKAIFRGPAGCLSNYHTRVMVLPGSTRTVVSLSSRCMPAMHLIIAPCALLASRPPMENPCAVLPALITTNLTVSPRLISSFSGRIRILSDARISTVRVTFDSLPGDPNPVAAGWSCSCRLSAHAVPTAAQSKGTAASGDAALAAPRGLASEQRPADGVSPRPRHCAARRDCGLLRAFGVADIVGRAYPGKTILELNAVRSPFGS